MSEEYDIEFLMPVVGKGAFKDRILDMFEHRLINLQDKKIRLCLVFGPEKEVAIDSPPNVDVVNYHAPFGCAANKLFWYYSNMSLGQIDKSKWFVRLDDDTATDVSGLYDNLEKYFGHNQPWYVVGKMKDDNCIHDRQALRDAGFGKLFEAANVEVAHEYEAAFFNQSALKKFLSSRDVKRVFKIRGKYVGGWGDQLFGYCSHIVGVYPAKAWFLCADKFLGNFSLFGGTYNHIHKMAHDHCKTAYAMHCFLMQEYKAGRNLPYSTGRFNGEVFEIHTKYCASPRFRLENNGNITTLTEWPLKIGMWYEKGNQLWINYGIDTHCFFDGQMETDFSNGEHAKLVFC